jgi:hypothetical protein
MRRSLGILYAATVLALDVLELQQLNLEFLEEYLHHLGRVYWQCFMEMASEWALQDLRNTAIILFLVLVAYLWVYCSSSLVGLGGLS